MLGERGVAFCKKNMEIVRLDDFCKKNGVKCVNCIFSRKVDTLGFRKTDCCVWKHIKMTVESKRCKSFRKQKVVAIECNAKKKQFVVETKRGDIVTVG